MEIKMIKKIGIGFVLQFAIDDFKTKYAGSLLGFLWAFLQPIITITIYWFVFQIGFKNDNVGDIPFILWLVTGIVPWLFASEAIINSTSSMVDYSYLVKKVVFNIDILPLARIASVLFVHIVLLLFTFVLYAIYGFTLKIYSIQILYYMLYNVIICIGISYFTASLFVFFKDIIQLVSAILQVIFWLTPIVWNIDIMPENVQKVVHYNPIFYVINGYRDALASHKWFFEYSSSDTFYYWMLALLILGAGIYTFNKLKTHFADVL